MDQNTHANSYTEVQVDKPYVAINNEIYIPFGHQELRNGKHIGYGYYCEELFVVNHESRYSCILVTLLMITINLNITLTILPLGLQNVR